MRIQRYTTAEGRVPYRARVKYHGREVATRVFDRKRDAEAWEDQKRKLRMGEWYDPRRGRVPLSTVATDWMQSRQSVKRSTRAVEEVAWRRHIEPRFGKVPVASITPADVAAKVKPPAAGHRRREGQFLTLAEADALAAACRGPHAEVVLVLALARLRWGELAGLKVGDRVALPGPGLRLQRAVLAGNDRGDLYVDTLKSNRARTVPLVPQLVPIIDRWSAGKAAGDWLFASPRGGPLHESNWKRAVGWSKALEAIGRPTLRVHDLRHTCASVWLGAGADPKVVQRILGHASAAMTMDLYGHLIDQNLWDAAGEGRGHSGGIRAHRPA